MSAMANTTPIVTTVTKPTTNPRDADATPRVNIQDFREKYYEDILPIIMDKVRRDKRKEVHARLYFGEVARARTTKPERLKVRDRLRYGDRHVLDRLGHRRQSGFDRLSETYLSSTTKSRPGRTNSKDHPRGRSHPRRLDTSNEDCPEDRERFCGGGESYDDSYSHSYHDRDRSRHMKRRRANESPLSSVSKSDSSDGRYWKSRSKRHKPTNEDDLTRPWICEEEDPFTPRIRNFKSSCKTRMPNNVKTYDGTGEPEDHVKIFQTARQVERWAMPTWCHMFNSALIGAARVWFNELPSESVDSYKDIKAVFLAYFMQQNKYVKDPVEIHNIKQNDGETIEDFMKQFKVETERMKGAPECMRISGFMHGVNNPELTQRLNEHVPKTMEEMMITTTAFIRGEAVVASKKKGHTSWRAQDQSKRTPKEILTAEAGKFQPPPPMVTPVEKRSNNKFCDFHNDKGHSTDESHGMLKFPVDGGIVTIRSTILIPAEYTTVITSSAVPKELNTGSISERDIHLSGKRKGARPLNALRPCKQRTTTKIERHDRRTQYYVPAKDVSERIDPSGFSYRNAGRKSASRASGRNSTRVVDTLHGWIFAASNNEAEYEALIAGLRIAVQMGVQNVHVSVDSKLVANQVLGTYVAKKENMIKYLEKVKSLISGFTNFSISQVPRSKNKKADSLSKIASTSFAHLSKQALVEILKEKSIKEKEVTTVVEEDGPTWMTSIMEYLKEWTLPSDRKESKKLRIKARQYELLEAVLYRRSFLTPWLRCVGPLQAEYMIIEIHEGLYSMHAGPWSVVAKAIRLRYYWPTMHRDARDMIRPGKVKFLIVAMDYFTKWMEAKAVVTITGNQACLGKGNKNWVEELPHVLWGHRTMIKSSYGDTPFSLTYGTEAVIPAEIRMPTYRTAVVDVVCNDEELRLNLDFLQERRKRAAVHEAKAKLKMTKYYNARVRGITFKPGDFVYRNNDASYAVEGGKLGPKWEGPYEVTEALGDGAYKLQSTNGTVLPKKWNITNLKRCYL
nr:reverse transcriptase domain-containing protein [Tanacetum cinerariifolium]